jgi:hypothetical protein
VEEESCGAVVLKIAVEPDVEEVSKDSETGSTNGLGVATGGMDEMKSYLNKKGLKFGGGVTKEAEVCKALSKKEMTTKIIPENKKTK